MSPSLPPEILDLIVDHLCHERNTLKTCCLASKSWVPRTRRHLFAHVCFQFRKSVKRWMQLFPDPSNSPAHHTRSLRIGTPALTLIMSSFARPLVCSFRFVVRLRLGSCRRDEFSKTIDLICSFPLLEHLSLWSPASDNDTGNVWVPPSTSPKLTGSLVLEGDGVGAIIPPFLSLPGGLQFTHIQAPCSVGNVDSIQNLLLGCSSTLESLRISCYTPRAFSSAPVADEQCLIATTLFRQISETASARPLQNHRTQTCRLLVGHPGCSVDH